MPEHSDAEPLQIDALGLNVIRVISQTQRIPIESISLDSTFEQLKIDSLDGINLVFAIENEFGVNIPDEGVQNLRSVRQTVEGVRQLLEEKTQLIPPGAA
jgi:acyl carrier protein